MRDETPNEQFALDIIDRLIMAFEDLFAVLSPFPALRAILAIAVALAIVWGVGFSLSQGWRLVFMLPWLRGANGVVKKLRESTQSAHDQLAEVKREIKKMEAILESILEKIPPRDPKSRTRKTDEKSV